MDYEKEYKKKLDDAKYWHDVSEGDITAVLEKIFPELKENEDERIRKIITLCLEECVHSDIIRDYEKDKCRAWLEKQVQKSFDYENATIIPKDFAPKEEPKFHEGDWVVDKNGTVQQILSYKNGIYKHTNGYSSKMFEDEWRLWDITKDAKDGDVLFAENFDNIGGCVFLFKGLDSWKFDAEGDKAVATGYCCASITESGNTDFGIQGPDCVEIKRVHPATKEQRNLLFYKMKESGYEWDAEKKELKLLITNGGDFCESENCEQNPADKIAPKFHEGDWIISNNKKSIYQVIEVDLEYNGKAMLHVLTKGVEQGKREILDKACEWLKKNRKNYSSNALGEEYLIDDFKKAMKEG